jgi:hypothetical protein
MFLNVSERPAYLEELFVLANNRHNLYSSQLRQIAKPQEFVTHLTPLGSEIEHTERQPDDVWQRAWEGKDNCLRVDFRYPYKSGRRALASLFFIRSNDGHRKEKQFELEAVLIPKEGNPCKVSPGVYR